MGDTFVGYDIAGDAPEKARWQDAKLGLTNTSFAVVGLLGSPGSAAVGWSHPGASTPPGRRQFLVGRSPGAARRRHADPTGGPGGRIPELLVQRIRVGRPQAASSEAASAHGAPRLRAALMP
jgi:hypothetical protein